MVAQYFVTVKLANGKQVEELVEAKSPENACAIVSAFLLSPFDEVVEAETVFG